MMHFPLKPVLLLMLVLWAARDTLGSETQAIQLASELDVGRELLKSCSAVVYEASSLCTGRKPFKLNADIASGCKSYYWCLPARGACVQACPQGTVFNLACNCCQDSTLHAVNLATCSSSASGSAATAKRRQLLSVDTTTAQPNTPQTIKQPSVARTVPASDEDSSITFHVSTGTVTDSKGNLIQPQQPASDQPSIGVWNTYGKRYSTGPWASKNAVKEPAVAGPRATTTPSSTVYDEAGNRAATHLATAARSTPHLPVSAEDDTLPAGRALLDLLSMRQHHHHQQQHGPASRHLDMKRVRPLPQPAAVSTAAAAHSSSDEPILLQEDFEAVSDADSSISAARAAQVPATAARAIDPADEAGAPFASHTLKAAQLVPKAASSTSGSSNGPATTAPSKPADSSSSSSHADVIEVGLVTGDEAEAAKREAANAAPVIVNPAIMPEDPAAGLGEISGAAPTRKPASTLAHILQQPQQQYQQEPGAHHPHRRGGSRRHGGARRVGPHGSSSRHHHYHGSDSSSSSSSSSTNSQAVLRPAAALRLQ